MNIKFQFFLSLFLCGSSILSAIDREQVIEGNLPERTEVTQQEVSSREYCAVLNTVAATDPEGFYNEKMESLVRSGSPWPLQVYRDSG